MSFGITWASAAIVCGVSGFIFTIAQIFWRLDRRIDERIQSYRKSVHLKAWSKGQSPDENSAPHPPWMERLVSWMLPQDRHKQQLKQRLQYAGYAGSSALVAYVMLQVSLMVGAAGVFASLTRVLPSSQLGWQLPAAFGACVGYLLPSAWLRRRKRVRLRILTRSIPDFLDLMICCLNAGLTLEAVLQRIAKEEDFGHELLAEEIRRVQREIELGATADRALQNCGERTDSDDMRSLARVCLQVRKYGATIASTLRAHADTLRNQREQQAEESAQKASVNILLPTLVCLFPVIFLVMAGPAAIRINENLTASEDQSAVRGE